MTLREAVGPWSRNPVNAIHQVSGDASLPPSLGQSRKAERMPHVPVAGPRPAASPCLKARVLDTTKGQ